MQGDEMNSYLEGYLRVMKYNEPDGKWNLAFRYLIPLIRYTTSESKFRAPGIPKWWTI